jgi:hypothetical protein
VGERNEAQMISSLAALIDLFVKRSGSWLGFKIQLF